MDEPSGPVTACGSCGYGDLEHVLYLGLQPLPQARQGIIDERRYPLGLIRCRRCSLVQLSHIVPQAQLFPPDYPYVTGNTKALRGHFMQLAAMVAEMTGPGDLVVDIGANDGTFLRLLDQDWVRAKGAGRVRTLAVEPTGQARKAEAAGIPVIQDYWTPELVGKIRQEHGLARVITAANVFGHVPDPHEFLDGADTLLAGDGTLIIDNQDWYNVVNLGQVDTIYHEHLRYYSPATLSALLEAHGFLVTSLTRTEMHGGALRAIAVRQRDGLQDRTDRLGATLAGMLRVAAEEGPVFAIGAPTRATSLVYWTGIGQYLACACEIAGSDKIGAVIPGTKVLIVDEQALFDNQPPNALLLAWDLEPTLVPLLRQRGYKGKIIIPLPEPHYVAQD